jgi:hypothetical protein
LSSQFARITALWAKYNNLWITSNNFTQAMSFIVNAKITLIDKISNKITYRWFK